jgi:aminopeptidase-like protein
MNEFNRSRLRAPIDSGAEAYELIRQLYPICRSITGEGARKTLAAIGDYISIDVHEVPSGTEVFDWAVPKEWNINDAYVKNEKGQRIIDFQECNLSVVSYSTPVRRKMSLSELRPRLHTLPEHPDWIPYRTSYYEKNWGFCLSHRRLQAMEEGTYEVVIDSSLENGSLTYGECLVTGATSEEVLIFSHICHPSLCNDNLSGIALSTLLAKFLSHHSMRYSYRFVFAPTTIGSITWLSRNERNLDRIKHGLVLSVAGDRGKLHYKKSRRGNAEIDRAVMYVLGESGNDFEILDFTPYGYDERQFCSPGINLPIGRLTRTPNGGYEEYHTSADNLTFVTAEALADSFQTCVSVIELLENNVRYLNTSPKGEPQLGKRGLYRGLGGYQDVGEKEFAMLWILNMSDGQNSVLDIAEHSGLRFSLLVSAAQELQSVGLLQVVYDDAKTLTSLD